MAIILPPQSTNQTVNVGLSPNAPLGAVSGIGGAVESSAQLLANSAKQSAALGRQFFDEAKAATDTARYSSAMNEAIVRIQ